MGDVNEYLKFTGSYDPLEQIFIPTKPTPNLDIFLFLFTIAHINRLYLHTNANALISKSPKDPIDGYPVMVGLSTLLQQYNKQVCLNYIQYLCQYVRLLVEENLR